MNARIPNWLRWLVLLPVSLGAGFLAAGLIHLLAIGPAVLSYAAAFLSGVAYVWAALYTAHSVAPTHKRVAVTVLGILILGDLSFLHLVIPTDLLQRTSDLEVIYVFLRVDDYAGLEHGGVVKIAGAVTGALLAWWKPVRGERPTCN